MKIKIIKILYQIKAFWYRLLGIKVGKNTFISGFPWFYRRNGGAIIIGNKVTLHSKKKYNTMEDFYLYGDIAPLGRLNWIYQNYIPGYNK